MADQLIAQLGNPVLRNKANRVTNLLDKNIQNLIDDMLKIVVDKKGVGIAAPQISQPFQIFIMA